MDLFIILKIIHTKTIWQQASFFIFQYMFFFKQKSHICTYACMLQPSISTKTNVDLFVVY